MCILVYLLSNGYIPYSSTFSNGDTSNHGGQVCLRDWKSSNTVGIDIFPIDGGTNSRPVMRFINYGLYDGQTRISMFLDFINSKLYCGGTCLSTNGYDTLLNGVLIQWGTVYIGQATSVAVTYPVSFNTCFAAFTQSTQTTSNDSYNNGTKVIS